MMKVKMLLAFVLVAGLGCMAQVSARVAQRRVGSPVPSSYKARLERIQRSGGFKARSGTRGGEFAAREGMHPQELELMVLQGKELTADQKAQLDQFHADNPEIAAEFEEAMIVEGLAVAEEEEEETEKEEVKSVVDTVLKQASTSPVTEEVKSEVASEVARVEEEETVTADQASEALADAENTLQGLKDSRSQMNWLSPFAIRKVDAEIKKQQKVVDDLKSATTDSAEDTSELKQTRMAAVKSALYQTITSRRFLIGVATVVTAACAGYKARDTEAMQTALSKANGLWNYVTDNKVCNIISSAASSAKDTVCGVSSKFVTAFNKITGRTAREMEELKSAALIGRALRSYKDVLQESPEKAKAVSEAILSLAMESGEYLFYVG